MFVLSCLYYHVCIIMNVLYSPKCLTGLCAKVHKKNFMKLIKTGTFPVKWNQLKFKSAQPNFTFIISSLKAHKGWKRNTRVFSLIFQEIWYLIRFHQQSFQALKPENQITRDFYSQLWYSPQVAWHKSVLLGLWVVWGAHHIT